MRQKFYLAICLLLLPLLLLSCGQKKDFLEILDRDFVCHAEGKVGGKPFSATLYASGRVVYDAPSALCGVIACEDGKTLTLDGFSLDAPALFGFFLPARLLLEDFAVSGAGADGKGGCYVDGTSEHGHRRVYLAQDGTPCRVEGSFMGVAAEFEIRHFREA